MLTHLPGRIERYFTHPSLPEATRGKAVIFSSCLLVLIPSIYLFAAINFGQNHRNHAWPAALLATVMLLVLSMMRSLRSLTIPFRLLASLSLLTLAVQLNNGAGAGNVFVWFYCYPMAVLFIAGKREGLLWVGASLFLSAWFFLLSPARVFYQLIDALRFLLTYSIVSAIAYGLESSRALFGAGLIKEKQRLEEALQQIKTLRGLLPICSSCKSIRDDHGYWNQLETYLNDHSEAKLSHGICPDCLQRLYPTEYAEMNNSGKLWQLTNGRTGTRSSMSDP
jgi:hypothetical protein